MSLPIRSIIDRIRETQVPQIPGRRSSGRFAALVGRGMRQAGISLDKLGSQMMGSFAYKEELSRHRRLMTFEGKKPTMAQGSWVAPSATLIGKVDVGDHTTIWYGAVLRGDVNNITIGKLGLISERVVIHCSSGNDVSPPQATVIGNSVVVEPGAILHACTIGDNVRIGAGAAVLDGAVVGEGSIVGAGSVVSAGKQIPAGEMWQGVPARFVRKVTPEEVTKIHTDSDKAHELSIVHEDELAKSVKQLEDLKSYAGYSIVERYTPSKF
eukprot:TRINITY_DN377_c0_g1_i1.p1 TRINITY_DN377_c0_g1~~TRINITY_DN377_c0_g1_i1.p1  ORF type:complete len:268 (-),score=97.47 TRINITY_DN377_c0_g1_i1:85-888(-)